MKKFILGTIFGLIISSGVVLAANYLYHADEVSYVPSDTNWNVKSVDQALNELYTSVNSIEPTPLPKYIFGYGGYSTTNGGGSATYSWWYMKNNMTSYSTAVVEWTSGYNYEDDYVKVSGSNHSRGVLIKKDCKKVQGTTITDVSANTTISSSGFYSITPFFLIFED